jgi:ribonucleoside-diphosphate reductase beta chain
MSEAMGLKTEKNFFEARVIGYQNGGALNCE